MITDEQFLEEMARDYPNENWDNLPDIESVPDVYIVKGRCWDEKLKRVEGFSVGKEYPTIEAAQAQVERCKNEWEGIEVESLKIEARKPDEIVNKWFFKDCLERIEKGEKVFPMYLP